MKKIAFMCVHDSCRSQIAEALGKYLRGGGYEFYSAGTETKPRINQDAVRLMKRLYGIDMERTQHSKLLSQIPAGMRSSPWAATSSARACPAPIGRTGAWRILQEAQTKFFWK